MRLTSSRSLSDRAIEDMYRATFESLLTSATLAALMISGSSELTRLRQSLMAIVDDIAKINLRLGSSAGSLRAAGSRLGELIRQCPRERKASLVAMRQPLEAAAKQCIEAGAYLNKAQVTARTYVQEHLPGSSSGSYEAPTSSLASRNSLLGGELAPGGDLEIQTASGVDLPPDMEAVSLSAVPGDLISPSLFEDEPAKGGAKLCDMIWAARCWRDEIIPHLQKGGTREQLEEFDRQDGRTGFRRRTGAWDVYFGSENATIHMKPDGSVESITGGRHRILAARLAGLDWIPMRVSRSG